MKNMIMLFGLFMLCLPLMGQEKADELVAESVSVIPSKMSYQGVLTDNNGNPQNGTFTMTFGLYTTPTGGSPLWSETQNTVQVNNGIFNVLLGSVNPINLAFDVTYYLGVSVQGTNLLPRVELASSGYSFNTARIQGKSISTSSPSTGQVLQWTGSEWAPGDVQGGSLWTQFSEGIYYNTGKVVVGATNSSGSVLLEIQNPYPNGAAIAGYDYQNDFGAGVFGYSDGFAAIQGNGNNGDYAGYFMGDVHVTGTLSKAGGSFEIDHPLDPQNKILRHSFVESPDMMNIYNGNVTTNDRGFATVQLPTYFEALNEDFRYQLTVIGQFAQAIVSDEIHENEFSIQTDKPNVKVSWQVTGIRKDPWAEKNRIVVEERKSLDTQGYYIHPESYGQPDTRSTEWARQPELMKRLSEEPKNNEYGKE